MTRPGRNPLRDTETHALALGLGVLVYPLDYDALEGPPNDGRRGTPEEQDAYDLWAARRATAMPWRVTAEHPCNVFFDPDNDPPEEFIIEKRVSLRDMRRKFPDADIPSAPPPVTGTGNGSGGITMGRGGPGRDAEYVEYISCDWYACFVNGVPVTPNGDEDGFAPNARGFPWVQLVWSGFGSIDADNSWERRGVGLLWYVINNFRSRAFDMNWLQLIKRAYIPKLVFQANTPFVTDAQEEAEDVDPTAPEVVTLSNKVAARYLETPALPQALLESQRNNANEIEGLMGPGVLSGESRSEPASKYSARLEQARSPYRAAKANMEQALANMLSHMDMDIKHEPVMSEGYEATWTQGYGADAQQFEVALKPKQINVAARNSVDLSPMTPQDRAFAVQDAIAKRDAGLVSTLTAMKDGAQVDDTAQEMAEIQVEEIFKNPLIQNALAQRVAEKLGLVPPSGGGAGPAGQGEGGAGAGAPGGPGGTTSASPAAGAAGGASPSPNVPLPPNVPQQPGPPLGSQQEATQGIQQMFSAPPSTPYTNGTRGY